MRWLVAAALIVVSRAALCDEGGVGFWLPGNYASFAAAPGDDAKKSMRE